MVNLKEGWFYLLGEKPVILRLYRGIDKKGKVCIESPDEDGDDKLEWVYPSSLKEYKIVIQEQ